MTGYVVAERDVHETAAEQDTARSRLTIGPEHGCELLEQRVVRFGKGRSHTQELGERQAVLYVAEGHGRLHVGDRVEELRPLTGAYVAAGEAFTVENERDEDVVVVLVTAPAEYSVPPSDGRTVNWDDRPSLPASPNREFRLLVDRDIGCHDITQFLGVIPPGRAPLHSHTYDEVVYVVEGEGVLHLGAEETPIGPGSCIHLPPLVEHCLENRGDDAMRILGVFHPAGSPASRASEASE
jgi:mannose-6-phosphate isomerase-like protein (cupin superfamily)